MAKKTKSLRKAAEEAFEQYAGSVGCGCCSGCSPPDDSEAQSILRKIAALERTVKKLEGKP